MPILTKDIKLISEPAPDASQQLNAVLKQQLTGINQYFLHARILKHKGFMKLADVEYKESITAMKHADRLVERILFLGGVPNLQEMGRLSIGESIDAILNADLSLEESASALMKTAIAQCRELQDFASAELFSRMLESQEERLQFVRTQLNLIDTLTLTAYLQTQV